MFLFPPADPGSAGTGVEAAGRGGGQLEQGLCHRGLGAGERDWGQQGSAVHYPGCSDSTMMAFACWGCR